MRNVDCAVVSEQGRRTHMEDTYFLARNFALRGWVFGGVYDGHNGEYAAEYAAHNLYKRFLGNFLRTYSPEKAFIRSYERISKELSIQDSGTCAANFFIKDGKIYYANAGDCRIILIQKSRVIQLTALHRATLKFERERIELKGGLVEDGRVWRNRLGLEPTRTLGDEHFKPVGVIATPSVGYHEITTNDLFLIAGTDGLFDAIGKKEIWELITANNLQNSSKIARALWKELWASKIAQDNFTIIVVSLKQFWK